jgi:hypothetical protein
LIFEISNKHRFDVTNSTICLVVDYEIHSISVNWESVLTPMLILRCCEHRNLHWWQSGFVESLLLVLNFTFCLVNICFEWFASCMFWQIFCCDMWYGNPCIAHF